MFHSSGRHVGHKACAACLFRVGYNHGEISRMIGVSQRTSKSACMDASAIAPSRSAKRVVACVSCLLRVGLGCRIIGKITNAPKTTIIRQRRRLGLLPAAAANARRISIGRGIPQRSPKTTNRADLAMAAAAREEANTVAILEGALSWVNHPEVPQKFRDWFRHQIKRKWYRDYYRKTAGVKGSSHHFVSVLRSRILAAIKHAKTKKADKSVKLLGCGLDEARLHISKQFQPGMSWENHGAWHIDHIKPIALFDLSNSAEQLECFNYRNLQPLWAKDNLSKGARYTE